MGTTESPASSFVFSLFSAGKSYTFSAGLLASKKTAGRSTFPVETTEWFFFERRASIHSGGTAPVFHRTSLLSPVGRQRTAYS
jgi:hypothetical protein